MPRNSEQVREWSRQWYRTRPDLIAARYRQAEAFRPAKTQASRLDSTVC
jgi:hypothetical protein